MGSGHLQGRSVLQQAGQACSLEPSPQGEGHQHGTLEGDQSSRTDPDGLHPGVQERQGRSFSDISRIRDLYGEVEQHRGGDAGIGTISEGIDRGGQDSQGGAEEHPSQEGSQQQRWLLRAASVDQDLPESLRASEQAFHVQPGEVGLSGTIEENSHQLRPSDSRQLSRKVDRMLHDVIEDWVPKDKTILMEVACGPDSLLSSTMQEITGCKHTAQRFALWNQHDLRSSDGVKSVLTAIDRLEPNHVWLAPECGPYSMMQNINQRNDKRRADLELKRRDALKQYVGCAIIFQYCIQKGIHVTWELSQTCQAWRLPLLQRLASKYEPHFAVVRGCQVNLRDGQNRFIKKGWRIMTTHSLMSERMNLPCTCDHRTPHVACEGSLTRKTAYYTKEFAKRVCETILHDTTRQQLIDEFQGSSKNHGMFGSGTVCVCEDGKLHDSDFQCGHCNEEVMGRIHKRETEHKRQTVGEGLAVDSKLQGLPKDWTPEEIRRRLYLLHAATGHGSKRHLLQVLKNKGVHPKILEAAEGFECPVCKERQRPQPRNLSSLEPVPQKFEVVSADVGHWINPKTKEKHQFVMFVDEGSRFRVARVVLHGKHQHVSASLFISTFRECWTQYFGYPRTLRMDPDGALRSVELADFCDQQQIYLDLIPGEAHWKLGTCERSIQATKTIVEKIIDDQPELSSNEALTEAIRVQNVRETVRGYSPMQHVLGLAPDELGRFFSTASGNSPELRVEDVSHRFEDEHRARLTAEKALLEWNSRERITRAVNSKHRSRLDFEAGDLVYIWRKQLTGKDAEQNKIGQGRFVGPARILAVEQKREPDGTLVRGSSVWLVRGRRLIKCCPEQLRRASEREVILDSLHRPEGETPWTFPKVVEELGGHDYDDLTDAPEDMEWERAGNPLEECQPTHRHRTKRPATSMPESSAFERAQPSSRTTTRPRVTSTSEPNIGFVEAPHWTEQVEESFFGQCDNPTNAERPMDYAFSIEVDMPSSRGGSEKALKDLQAYMTNAFKRKAIEVSEKRLSEDEKKQMAIAKGIEVNNFIAARAFESLPANMRVDKSQAVKMRWILTWKVKDTGERKAKARAVLLGYQDPHYEQRATTSPTTTRQTRQMQLQIAAAKGFQTYKGDVTGAFLQSREYPDNLLCLPCPEILEAMGLPSDAAVRVKKACYGLVDAPLEWYRSICTFFSKLGLRRCWSDPCCWTYVKDGILRGLISGHVDDFMFSGLDGDMAWKHITDLIKKEYKWGEWESNRFVQCGVLVERHGDGSYELSQEKYVDELKYINIRAHRRKEKHESTDGYEKSALRTLLGGISWHAQQVAPHFSAEVGMLLSEVNHSTVETLLKANTLLDQVKNMKQHRLKIHPIPLEETILVAWADAAANNRVDGGSTQGIVIGATKRGMLSGECEQVSILTWHSSKIQRVCTSPGSSEALAAVNAEDLLFFARFQFGEMIGNVVNVQDVNSVVNAITGCLVTDSRNVYDKVSTEVLCTKGAERRVDITLMRLKESQTVNQVMIRWVHSDAQLANSLTKGKELRQILLFYDMQQRWRIVDDPTMSSARKRKQKGQTPLEQAPNPQVSTTQDINLSTSK